MPIVMTVFFQIMTATVETVSEQLDLAAIIPAEKVVSAVARAITLSDSDVGKTFLKSCVHVNSNILATATSVVTKPQSMNESDEPTEPGPDDDLANFWHTSIGKFKVVVEDLPEYLQYLYEQFRVGIQFCSRNRLM